MSLYQSVCSGKLLLHTACGGDLHLHGVGDDAGLVNPHCCVGPPMMRVG